MKKLIGIYDISCQVDDEIRGIYVGQSTHLTHRWTTHQRRLIAGTHVNPILQSLVFKYGIESLHFRIIEECSIEDLTNREQYWLDHHRGEGYKICNIGDTVATPMLGYKHSAKTRQRLSEINQGRQYPDEFRTKMSNLTKNPSTETREKIGRAHRGKSVSPETRRRISESKKGIPGKNKVSPEDAKKIRELRNQGLTIKAIQAQFTYSFGTIQNVVKKRRSY